jgi:glycosyltransferase involved in cell wall biosynthesis
MLILHILVNLNPGGAERMLQRLLQAQSNDPRFEHRVISLGEVALVGAELRDAGVEVEALGMRSSLHLPRTFARLVKAMRRHRPDIVQCWMYHADLLGGLAARLAGVERVIWGVRSVITGRVGMARSTLGIRWLCARLSKHLPDRIVYVARSARERHERLGYDPGKSQIIPNGYPTKTGYHKPALGSELALPAESFIVGSAGRYCAVKDFGTFIAAAARLKADPRFRFVMIGGGLSRDNDELEAMLAQAGVRDRFHLLGHRHDIFDCLAGLDLFCLHSVDEGFPNVVAEAMSVETPCVVTDVGDAAFIIGSCGPVIPHSRPDLLAEEIAKIAALSPAERSALGVRSRERILANFSIESVSERYAALYAELAGLAPARAEAD